MRFQAGCSCHRCRDADAGTQQHFTKQVLVTVSKQVACLATVVADTRITRGALPAMRPQQHVGPYAQVPPGSMTNPAGLLNNDPAPAMACPTHPQEFDGGARNNPGPAGFGCVLVENSTGRHLEYVAGPLPGATNNVAEWTALAAGMQVGWELVVVAVCCCGPWVSGVEGGRVQVHEELMYTLGASAHMLSCTASLAATRESLRVALVSDWRCAVPCRTGGAGAGCTAPRCAGGLRAGGQAGGKRSTRHAESNVTLSLIGSAGT